LRWIGRSRGTIADSLLKLERVGALISIPETEAKGKSNLKRYSLARAAVA